MNKMLGLQICQYSKGEGKFTESEAYLKFKIVNSMAFIINLDYE